MQEHDCGRYIIYNKLLSISSKINVKATSRLAMEALAVWTNKYYTGREYDFGVFAGRSV